MKKLLILFLLISILFVSDLSFAAITKQHDGPIMVWTTVSDADAEDCRDLVIDSEDWVTYGCDAIIYKWTSRFDLLYYNFTSHTTGVCAVDYNEPMIAQFREINDDIYLIEYANGQNYAGNIWGRNCLDSNESYFFHDPYDSTTKTDRYYNAYKDCNPSLYNTWVYNWGVTGFQNFFADQVVDAMQAGMDGLWVDNMGLHLDSSNNPKFYLYDDYYNSGACDGSPSLEYPLDNDDSRHTNAEYETDRNAMAAVVRTAIDGENSGLSDYGRPFITPINIFWELVLDDDPSSWLDGNASEETMLASWEGALTEGASPWFTPINFDTRNWYEGSGTYDHSEWKDSVDKIKWMLDQGYTVLYKGKASETCVYDPEEEPQDCSPAWEDGWDGGTSNEGRPGSRIMMAYGSALLAAGEADDMFFFLYLYSHESADWGGYDIELGWKVGDYFLYPGTTEADPIYAAKYENGLVLVNPTNAAIEVDPVDDYNEISNYKLFDDNSGKDDDGWIGLTALQTDSINVGAYSAEILYVPGAFVTFFPMTGKTVIHPSGTGKITYDSGGSGKIVR